MNYYDTQNISEILRGDGDYFTAKLFRLIAHADQNNREKLFASFPHEVNLIHEYLTGKQFGIAECSNEQTSSLTTIN